MRHVAITVEFNMQLFNMIMLVFEQHFAPGLTFALACAVSATILLAFRAPRCELSGPQHGPEATWLGGCDQVLGEFRAACHEFDREVETWEQAARGNGGSL
jgi:hypothetical protein